MIPSSKEIVRSYRHLYRHGMYAIQYASPAKYTLKVLLEHAYRTGNAADFDAQKINNTITFLEGAARETGLEHKILKNLLHTWFWELKSGKNTKSVSLKTVNMRHEQSRATLQHFEITLKRLNESMGMCLPTTFATKREPPSTH